MKVIADMNDSSYYKARARELVSVGETEKELIQAIGLLALSVAKDRDEEAKD